MHIIIVCKLHCDLYLAATNYFAFVQFGVFSFFPAVFFMTVALSIRLLLFVHYMFLIKCNALLYFQSNNANDCHNVQFSFISE